MPLLPCVPQPDPPRAKLRAEYEERVRDLTDRLDAANSKLADATRDYFVEFRSPSRVPPMTSRDALALRDVDRAKPRASVGVQVNPWECLERPDLRGGGLMA
jgi:hypothetical protein